ncbi:YlzJ-like family protein [Bacillus massilinigeriensis]|uniref:YlzJ-like family protein n=1 Tax=Bacillus mediterraneensis TaxID=1805474 RepID=UPI0008F81918|nr:YlzJ-like family protein [Bacillus mediterraneensis]
MILYTMMPHEFIYPQEHKEPAQSIVHYRGVPIIAERAANNDYYVVRIISTNPAHYLIDECRPGSKISFGQNERL